MPETQEKLRWVLTLSGPRAYRQLAQCIGADSIEISRAIWPQVIVKKLSLAFSKIPGILAIEQLEDAQLEEACPSPTPTAKPNEKSSESSCPEKAALTHCVAIIVRPPYSLVLSHPTQGPSRSTTSSPNPKAEPTPPAT